MFVAVRIALYTEAEQPGTRVSAVLVMPVSTVMYWRPSTEYEIGGASTGDFASKDQTRSPLSAA